MYYFAIFIMYFISYLCFLQYLPAGCDAVTPLVRTVKSRRAVESAIGRDFEHRYSAELFVMDHAMRFLYSYIVHETS